MFVALPTRQRRRSEQGSAETYTAAGKTKARRPTWRALVFPRGRRRLGIGTKAGMGALPGRRAHRFRGLAAVDLPLCRRAFARGVVAGCAAERGNSRAAPSRGKRRARREEAPRRRESRCFCMGVEWLLTRGGFSRPPAYRANQRVPRLPRIRFSVSRHVTSKFTKF